MIDDRHHNPYVSKLNGEWYLNVKQQIYENKWLIIGQLNGQQ